MNEVTVKPTIEEVVTELLATFYERRIEKINTLKFKDALSRKNPYLYKATGMENAQDIIKEILSDYMSSSDEGIFGDAFFEVLAERVSGGQVAETEGIDIFRIKDNTYQAIAVKSGTNVFNASSRKKQLENFETLRKRVAKRKQFYQPIIGYGYGKKTTSEDNPITELAGQEFWEELTGDSEFYLKIIELIGNTPQKYLVEYKKAFDTALNSFTKEFTSEFCNTDGSIDWFKLVKFNSGKQCKKLEVIPKSNKALESGESFQIEVKAIFTDEDTEDLTGKDEVNYIIDGAFEDKISITDDGIVQLTANATPGEKIKVIISCYQRQLTRSFSLRKNSK